METKKSTEQVEKLKADFKKEKKTVHFYTFILSSSRVTSKKTQRFRAIFYDLAQKRYFLLIKQVAFLPFEGIDHLRWASAQEIQIRDNINEKHLVDVDRVNLNT